jgi:hypothetical protein
MRIAPRPSRGPVHAPLGLSARAGSHECAPGWATCRTRCDIPRFWRHLPSHPHFSPPLIFQQTQPRPPPPPSPPPPRPARARTTSCPPTTASSSRTRSSWPGWRTAMVREVEEEGEWAGWWVRTDSLSPGTPLFLITPTLFFPSLRLQAPARRPVLPAAPGAVLHPGRRHLCAVPVLQGEAPEKKRRERGRGGAVSRCSRTLSLFSPLLTAPPTPFPPHSPPPPRTPPPSAAPSWPASPPRSTSAPSTLSTPPAGRLTRPAVRRRSRPRARPGPPPPALRPSSGSWSLTST